MTPQTPTRRPKQADLSRDERIRVLTLRGLQWTYQAIADYLHITIRQVQTACTAEHPTPGKRTGRPTMLNPQQIEELVRYVCSSRTTRLMSYLHLATGPFSHWQVGQYVIRHALRQEGFSRYIARAKPPLSPKNIQSRLQWALEHRHWTQEQWSRILWTDETWVTGARHRRQWVTRRKGEELDPTCVIDKIRKRKGWMFWGSFSGTTKGPYLFWEKEWGTINQESYCTRIVPLIDGWIRLNPALVLMQDGAPGHSAGETYTELRERGITVIYWPAYSPDLNPIETVWNWMKQYIEETYGDVQLSYDRLRAAVQEAWDSITEQRLQELIGTMGQRCQDVIDAQGGHTRW